MFKLQLTIRHVNHSMYYVVCQYYKIDPIDNSFARLAVKLIGRKDYPEKESKIMTFQQCIAIN